MKKRYLILILLLIALLLFNLNYYQKIVMVNGEMNIDINAKSFVVMEQTSGRVLMQKEKDVQLPMASTTKIMTALITIENCKDLDAPIQIDDKAIGIEGTSIYLKKGETLTTRELLYGLILASGNDCAVALACEYGNKNVQTFVDKMNLKAQELGCKNTHFDNPHGLDSKTHYTSAFDLALITKCASNNELFMNIVGTPLKQISSVKEAGNRFLRNKVKLLKTYEFCLGGKTGFTDNAGRCCVSFAKKDNMNLICVVLNCPDMFNASQSLFEKSFEEYKMSTILEPYQYLTSLPVENGEQEKVKIFTRKGFEYPLKEGEEAQLSIEKDFPSTLTAPIQKEQEIGKLKIYFDKDLIFSENIYTINQVEDQNISHKMKHIIEKWFYN